MKAYSFAILILCLILFSCSKSDNMRLLEQADAIIEDDPETSMNILMTVDTNTFNDEESAYYALLFTQSQIKNWVEVDSDTLICRAYNYYKDRNEGDRTIRAYFYNAKVAHNAGNLRASMRYVLPAYEMAKEQINPFWIAKSAELLYDIYFEVYNYPQAEFYSRITIENYAKAGKIKNQRYAIADLGNLLIKTNKDRIAVELLDSLRNVVINEASADSNLIKYIQAPYLEAILNLDSLKATDTSTILDIINKNDTTIDYNNTLLKTWSLQQQNKYQEAERTLNQALLVTENEADKASLLYEKYLNAVKAENFKEACIYTDSLLILQNNVVKDLLFNSVDEQKSNYYKESSEIMKLKKEAAQKKLFGIIIFSTCLILLLLIICYLILKNKRIMIENTLTALMSEKERVEKLILQRKILEDELKDESEKINKLKEELYTHQLQSENNSLTIQSLFRNQWNTLNLLCYEYYEKYDSENTRKTILKNIEKEIHKQRRPESLKEIEDSVNCYMSDILKHLRAECPHLNEDEYILVMLNYAGFSIRAICLLTNIKYKTFHNKKSRIIKKIQQSGSPNTYKYISMLS